MTILIKNGRVLNPSENMDKVMDVLIEDGLIKKKAENIQCDADKVIDAQGCYVMPGLIDLHVHFRDPGHTKKTLKQEAGLLLKVALQQYAVCQIQSL